MVGVRGARWVSPGEQDICQEDPHHLGAGLVTATVSLGLRGGETSVSGQSGRFRPTTTNPGNIAVFTVLLYCTPLYCTPVLYSSLLYTTSILNTSQTMLTVDVDTKI